MDLRQLRYFVTVAGERNFTRAAEKLNIAQPPLSRQIQQLEEELGVPLFERRSRPLHLTEAGQFLHEHALDVLERVEVIRTMIRRLGPLQGGGSASASPARPSTVPCPSSSAASAPPFPASRSCCTSSRRCSRSRP